MRPSAPLEDFSPLKTVGLASGQLRRGRRESWPSSSHLIVGTLQALHGRGSPRGLKVIVQA